jgi:hypothetical protein
LNSNKTQNFCKKVVEAFESFTEKVNLELFSLSASALDFFWALLFYDCADEKLATTKIILYCKMFCLIR